VGTVILVAIGCSNGSETTVVSTQMAQMQADNVVYGMTQILTKEGLREGVVKADSAYFYQDSSAVHLMGVHMTIYAEDGSERAQVVANRGRLDTNRQEMLGEGDVVLTIPGAGRTIRTGQLHYSSADDRIWSDTYTIMEEDGEVTCGSAFHSDLEFRNVLIEHARTAGCRQQP